MGKITRGHNSVKNVGGVMVFVFYAHRLMMVYCFMEIYLMVLKL